MSTLAFSAGADECHALTQRIGQFRELLDALARGGGPLADDARGASQALARACADLGEAEAILLGALEAAA